jgi:hypothetical protein
MTFHRFQNETIQPVSLATLNQLSTGDRIILIDFRPEVVDPN